MCSPPLGIRQHLQHVVFRTAGILLRAVQVFACPPLEPLHFDLFVIVLLFRHFMG